jgi:hypothetical protein
MPRVAVFVLGTPRGGTSAVTRAVNLLGVPIGDRSKLKRPDANNPAGFWEVPELSRVNHLILHAFGRMSMAPAQLPSGWVDEPWLADVLEGAAELGRAALGEPPWVWKHPLTSFTLPLWTRALGVAPVIVLPVRHPLETAASLSRYRGRDGDPLTPRDALAVWERYVRSALSEARGKPVFVLPSFAVVEAIPATLHALGEFLLEEGPAATGRADRAAAIASVRPGLRHHAAAPDQLAAGEVRVSPEQARLWRMARDLAGPHRSLPAVDLGPETAWVAGVVEDRLEIERAKVRRREEQALRDERRSLTARRVRHRLRRARKALRL